jgi:hypothetical protein
LDVLHRSRQREPRLVRVAGAVLHGAKPGKALQLGRDDLLLKELLTEGAVAFQQRLVCGRRWNEELPVALLVEDVQRHRMNVGRCQVTKHEPRRVGEELRDEPGLLLGRKRAECVHEVLGESRIVLQPGADPLVGHIRDRLWRAKVGESRRQAGRGRGVAGVTRPEPLALRGAEEIGAPTQCRPAEGDRRVVAAELRLRDAGPVQEELVRVELLVLKVVAGRSAEAIRARAGDQVDVPAAVAAARGGRERRLHFDFLQRVQRDVDAAAEAAAGVQHVGRVHAVDPQSVVRRARAVDARVE